MMSLTQHIMITCRHATELIERQSLRAPTVGEKLKLRLHLMMCKPCKQYSIQSSLIDAVLHRIYSEFKEASLRTVKGNPITKKIIASLFKE